VKYYADKIVGIYSAILTAAHMTSYCAKKY